jgi:carbamoyltransferase
MNNNHICFSIDHDSSVALLQDGKLVCHFIEERLTGRKHAEMPLVSLKEVTEILGGEVCSSISTASLYPKQADTNWYTTYLSNVCKMRPFTNYKSLESLSLFVHTSHHFLHALIGFYRSNFEDALCLVLDGAGTKYNYGKEHETIFYLKKTDNSWGVEVDILHQRVLDFREPAPPFVEPKSFTGAGFCYSSISEHLGFSGLCNGKTMGLSSYGKDDPNIEPILTKDEGGNNKFDLIRKKENIDGPRRAVYIPNEYEKTKASKKDIAYRLQTDYENYLIYLCKEKMPQLSQCKNIVISGGCGLNCVANYKLLKELGDDYSLYVEPICDDVGTSIGGAVSTSIQSGIKNIDISGIYFGQQLQYDYTLNDKENEKDVTSEEVAKLIADGNIVAIAQGRSESGPRALGNRSILFDPRVVRGNDIVNMVKKRECFRPFAGTVLLEHAKDWFDMDKLDESPYMTYAVDVLKEKQHQIPAITHVDGTCRVQTVTEKQNKHYYSLISDFYKLTGVPMVLNTSFNLAGYAMVETIEDALHTLRHSEIEYLYLPEIGKLINVPQFTDRRPHSDEILGNELQSENMKNIVI